MMSPTPPQTFGNYTWEELRVDQSIDIEIPIGSPLATFAENINASRSNHRDHSGASLLHNQQSRLAWYISSAIHQHLPGTGSHIQQLTLTFSKSPQFCERAIVCFTIIEKQLDSLIKMHISVRSERDESICEGVAFVQAPTDKVAGPHPSKNSTQRHAKYRLFLGQVKKEKPVPTAVVYPCDELSLQSCREAVDEELIEPILIGPESKILQIAAKIGWNLSGHRIIHQEDAPKSAAHAVELVHRNEARMMMKGALHSDDLLREVVKSNGGLRCGRRISHVFIMDVPGLDRPLLISDAAINIAPDLKAKADITRNAIDLAHTLGITNPKVAILSAIETVNPNLPSSVDADSLTKMAERGEIQGGMVYGPLAMDNAINVQAARTKGIKSAVAGNADILIVPNIEAGNMLVKELTFLGNADCAGIVIGAKVPIILNSRADNLVSRLASCAVAVMVQQTLNPNQQGH
jgi:phosphate butyryltransferase